MQSAIDPELLMLSKTNKRERRRHHAMRTLAILMKLLVAQMW